MICHDFLPDRPVHSRSNRRLMILEICENPPVRPLWQISINFSDRNLGAKKRDSFRYIFLHYPYVTFSSASRCIFTLRVKYIRLSLSANLLNIISAPMLFRRRKSVCSDSCVFLESVTSFPYWWRETGKTIRNVYEEMCDLGETANKFDGGSRRGIHF